MKLYGNLFENAFSNSLNVLKFRKLSMNLISRFGSIYHTIRYFTR